MAPSYASSHAVFSATHSTGKKSQFSLRISLRTQWKSLLLLYINLWSLCLFNILYDERGSTLKLHSEVWQLSPGKALMESDLGPSLTICFSWNTTLLFERTTERHDLHLSENAIKVFFPFSNCLSVCLDFHLYLDQNNVKHKIKYHNKYKNPGVFYIQFWRRFAKLQMLSLLSLIILFCFGK